MKKLIISAIAISSFFIATAQHAAFGVKGGLNVASVNVKTSAYSVDPRISAHFGGLAHIHLSEQFALQPELTFSGQGFKINGTGANADQHYNLNYLNLPVLLQYMFNSGFRIETGPQLGALLSAKHKVGSVQTDINSSYKTLDFSWDFGLGYLTPSGFGIDARYNPGIAKINDGESPKVTNSVFQAGVFYQFHPVRH